MACWRRRGCEWSLARKAASASEVSPPAAPSGSILDAASSSRLPAGHQFAKLAFHTNVIGWEGKEQGREREIRKGTGQGKGEGEEEDHT